MNDALVEELADAMLANLLAGEANPDAADALELERTKAFAPVSDEALALAEDAAVAKLFDPDQPRDEQGRWTDGGRGASLTNDERALLRLIAKNRSDKSLRLATGKDHDTLFHEIDAIRKKLGLWEHGYTGPQVRDVARELVKFEKKTASEVEKKARSGGFSLKPGRPAPTTGIMVALPTSEGLTATIPAKGVDPAEVRASVIDWLKVALPKVQSDPRLYLGGWLGDDGNLYFDVSERFDTKDEEAAKTAGVERNQRAIFRLDDFTTIETGGTGLSVGGTPRRFFARPSDDDDEDDLADDILDWLEDNED